MAAITDKFGKASIDTDYAIATTVKTTRVSGATVLEAFDLSKFSDDTPVFFVTYKKTTDPVTGVVSVTNLVSWKGLVNVGANTITNLTLAPGYADTGNAIGDFIECIPTSFWENTLIDGIFVGHNPDGTFKVSAVNDAINTILSTNLNQTLGNQFLYSNAMINGGCEVAQRVTAPALTTAYLYGAVDRFAAKGAGTAVTAGTISQSTAPAIAAQGYSLKLSGVTITGVGIAYLRYRMEARDALKFVNQAASFAVKVRQDTGGSVNYTVVIRKPTTTADDFSATTVVATGAPQSVPTAADTMLKLENINAGNLGDVSKGLEIEIQMACGAVTTKNFEFYGFQFNRGATASAFIPKGFNDELQDCLRYYEKSNDYLVDPGASAGLTNGAAYSASQYIVIAPANTTTSGARTWKNEPFKVAKRTTPTMRYWDGAGNISKNSIGDANLGTVYTNQAETFRGLNSYKNGFVYQTAPTGSWWWLMTYDADAEL